MGGRCALRAADRTPRVRAGHELARAIPPPIRVRRERPRPTRKWRGLRASCFQASAPARAARHMPGSRPSAPESDPPSETSVCPMLRPSYGRSNESYHLAIGLLRGDLLGRAEMEFRV